MTTVTKFDGKISFSLWKVKMRAIITQNGLKKALRPKPSCTTEEEWELIKGSYSNSTLSHESGSL